MKKLCEVCGHPKGNHTWREAVIDSQGIKRIRRASDLGYPCNVEGCSCKGYVYSGAEKTKRGVDDIPEFKNLDEVVEMVLNAKPIPYTFDREEKQRRDKALLAMQPLTAARISEILALQKYQFDETAKPGFVVIREMIVLKRRKKVTIDKPLSKTGILAPLTNLVMKQVHATKGKHDFVFDLGRHRAWEITRQMTGLWCHYFRSQKFSFLINKTKLKEGQVAHDHGVANIQTMHHYHKSNWEDHPEAYNP